MKSISVTHVTLKTLAALSALSMAFISGCSTETNKSSGATTAAATATLVNDAYAALGNAPLSIAAAQGVLANDSGAAQITMADDTSTQGGTVAMNLDGSFVYHAPLGFTGVDTFTYSVAGATATVTLNVDKRVWFVKNNVAVTGDGSFEEPFLTLAEAQSAMAANDIIFVFAGDGTSNHLTTGLTLLDGVEVHGEGSALEVSGTTIVAAGTKPLLARTGADGIILANNNVIKGLKINGVNDDAIDGDAFANLTIDNVEIYNTSASTLDHGIELTNILTGTIAIRNSNIHNTSGNGLYIDIDDEAAVKQVVTIELTSNTLNSNGVDGAYLSLREQSDTTLQFANNTFSSNGSNGIEIDGQGQIVTSATIQNNTISANASWNGIDADFWSSAHAKLYILNNTIQNHSGDLGYHLQAWGSAYVRTKVDGNTFAANTWGSIYLYSINTSYMCAAVDNNSSDDDLIFERWNSSTFEREILDNNTGNVVTTGSVVSGLPNGHCGL